MNGLMETKLVTQSRQPVPVREVIMPQKHSVKLARGRRGLGDILSDYFLYVISSVG